MEPIESKNFTPRERAILTFVDKHQGCSKQDVIDELERDYSPIPVRNSIDDLKRLGVLSIRPSELNRQTKALFTNKQNALVTLFNQLNDFESSFFALLDKLQESGKTKYPMPEGMVGYLNMIDMIYEQFIGMCLLHAFLDWPHDVKDPVFAVRLYDLLFSKLYDVSIRLADAFEKLGINLSFSLVQRFWLFRPHEINVFMDLSKKHEVELYGQDILNQLWKLSKDYAPHLEWAYKKGYQEKLDRGEQPPRNTRVFDHINEWLNYLNVSVDEQQEKPNRKKKRR
jgi:hypothetical protein